MECEANVFISHPKNNIKQIAPNLVPKYSSHREVGQVMNPFQIGKKCPDKNPLTSELAT